MSKFKIILCFALIAILSGCVTTKTTSVVDPDYQDGYQIQKAVLRIDGATMEETQIVEGPLSQELERYGVEVIRYTDIVPPTRQYSAAKIAKLLKNTKSDSVLTISVATRDSIESYIPPTYHAGTSTSYVNTVGNIAYVNTHTTPGYTTGGYSVSEPIMFTLSSLTDLKKGRIVWQAEGQTSGGDFSSYPDLLLHAGTDAIKNMSEKGLLPMSLKE